MKEVEGSFFPDSWKDAVSTILSGNEEHIIVMVSNGLDSGKTSFCAYLATNALREKRK